MRHAQYLTEVPHLLCIIYASALVFANVFSAVAPNDPSKCFSYSAGGTARLDMNCESFGGRIPLNVTIPTDHELEFMVGIDRELAGKQCRYSDPHDRVRATLTIRSGCDECYIKAIYFHSLGNRNAVWYLDADGLEDMVVALFKNHTDSVTFNVNGSRIVMTLPHGKSHDKYEIGCRIDPCLEQESQKTYQLSFETADAACGFYVKFPASDVLFPSAYTSTAYQLSQTSTTDSITNTGKSTSTAFPETTAAAARQFIDGSTVEITQPSVDIELSLPADEPLTFKMSFPHNNLKQLEDCMLEIISERCTLSASFKRVFGQGTFVFEGARLQREHWVYWRPLVTIRERTATLSDETNTQTTRLPCELAFQKDEATNRQRVVLRLKADFGLCNAKLIFVTEHCSTSSTCCRNAYGCRRSATNDNGARASQFGKFLGGKYFGCRPERNPYGNQAVHRRQYSRNYGAKRRRGALASRRRTTAL
ncbi:hypothetical protein AAVH_03577 [Aphelenchoides avenae]|nr:hypothetical protein AAVH_03577 [Aphelenchus avenae]